jgi:hypothetical protein
VALQQFRLSTSVFDAHMWMRVDVLVILLSFLYLGGVLGGALDQEAEQRLIDSSQPDFERLGAQIEQQWQEFIKVCP